MLFHCINLLSWPLIFIFPDILDCRTGPKIRGFQAEIFNCAVEIVNMQHVFLAKVNSRSRSLYAIARPSVVCLSSVTFVRPTQTVEIFGNISMALGTLAIH